MQSVQIGSFEAFFSRTHLTVAAADDAAAVFYNCCSGPRKKKDVGLLCGCGVGLVTHIRLPSRTVSHISSTPTF
jgi:hypothetical protein